MSTTTVAPPARPDRPASDAFVTLLDLSAALAEVAVRYPAESPEAPAPAPMYRYALARDTAGTLFAVCDEGVGWEVTAEEPLLVDVYRGMVPLGTLRLSPERVIALATGDVVPLHAYVRAFGSRLESNYLSWAKRLTGKYPTRG